MEENDCQENIPPVPNVTHYNVSTPASQLSRLEFAPTPFLKAMNKCPPESLKCGLSPLQDVPRFPFGGRGAGTASGWLYDETLPEITLLDESRSFCSPCDSRQRAASNSSLPTIDTAVTTTKANSPEAPHDLSKLEMKGFWLDDKNFPDITLLEMTRDDESAPRGETNDKTETSAEDAPCSQPANIPVTNETSLFKNPICSAIKESDSSDVQHSPTEGQSLLNSSSTAVEAAIDLQNNTLECEQPPTETHPLTLSETISNDSLQKTMDKDTSECEQPPTQSGSIALSQSISSDRLQKTMEKDTSECEQPHTETCSISLSQSSSNDSLQKTMEKQPSECEQPHAKTGSQTLSESSSSDRLQKTMDKDTLECEQPPTQSGSITLSQSISSDRLQKTMEKDTSECEQPHTETCSISLSQSSSNDSLQKTMEKQPAECEQPHAKTGSQTLSESSSSDHLQKTMDKDTLECEQPPTQSGSITLSESSSTDHLQKTMEKHTECEQLPTESGSITLSESISSDRLQKTMEKDTSECEQPYTQTGSLSLSESSSRDHLQKTMEKDASECEQPPTETRSITLSQSSSIDHLQKTMEKHTECEQPLTQSGSITLSQSSSSDHLQKTMEKHPSECDHPLTQAGSLTLSESSSRHHLQKTMEKHPSECEQPPTESGSITLSQSSSSDHLQKTMDRLPSPQICNLTTSLKEGPSEVQHPQQSGSKGTEPADNPKNLEGTFQVGPVLDASAAGRRESKDHRKSLALTDVSDNSISYQLLNAEPNKASTFNLDETLDLGVESLVTSTPIVHCKVFTEFLQHGAGRNPGAQKKLLGEEPTEPAAQVAAKGPANIIGDRKTFLTWETKVAKPRLPPPKPSSQLFKNKPAFALPGRFQPATSGLPVTRQQAQTEACRNAAPSNPPKQTTGTSCTYNLRTTTTGLKRPVSGLRKPQESGIPPGIQRITRGLKMPTARGNAQAPKNLCGPAAVPSSTAGSSAPCDTASRARALKPPANGQRAATTKSKAPATNPAPKTITAKKHPLPRNEAVPPKKLKIEPVSSSNPVAAASCQTADTNAQTHGCANCAELEKQNEVMAEEIKRLNKELLQYKEDN